MLHVTNGDAAAEGIRASGLGGEILPWRDVLHDGPVPPNLSDADLRPVRAAFLAKGAPASEAEIQRDFEERDARFAKAGEGGQDVVLWFEHDYYDQLQLLQILDRCAPSRTEGPGWQGPLPQIICIDQFPGVEPFHGLGQLDGKQMASLWPQRRPVTEEMVARAQRGWKAFREADAEALYQLSQEKSEELPFLAPALIRHLEELPGTGDGLARSERQALEELTSAPRGFGPLFRACQEREEAPYCGDLSFFQVLQRLRKAPVPLIESDSSPNESKGGEGKMPPPEVLAQQTYRLTEAGRRVLGGEADQVELNGLARWWGGLHLEGRHTPWRWDHRKGRPVQDRV